jgi:hypothetical protein
VTLARDLRDLRPAQRSGASSPRLPGVAAGRPSHGSWPLGGSGAAAPFRGPSVRAAFGGI